MSTAMVMQVKSKFWLEVDGQPVFGEGRKLLLMAIDTYGSINRAAREMNISYRRAWSYVTAMEQRLNIKLVEKRTGGKHGGGTSLTEEGRTFLTGYHMMEQGIQEIIDEKFRTVFRSHLSQLGPDSAPSAADER